MRKRRESARAVDAAAWTLTWNKSYLGLSATLLLRFRADGCLWMQRTHGCDNEDTGDLSGRWILLAPMPRTSWRRTGQPRMRCSVE